MTTTIHLIERTRETLCDTSGFNIVGQRLKSASHESIMFVHKDKFQDLCRDCEKQCYYKITKWNNK